MASIVQMILNDSYKIRDIDRLETIKLTYKLKNGVLEEIKSPHEISQMGRRYLSRDNIPI